jgi:hypothetical protein
VSPAIDDAFRIGVRSLRAHTSEMIQIAVKMLLSGTLLVLAILCAWEICRIWFDRSLVLAPFDYLDSGKPSAETGEQFARMVRVEMVRLASLYGVDESASTAALPSTDQIGRAESVEIPAVFRNDFDSIEFKAYGVDFGNIFKSMRRFIETPGEITGSVTVQNNLYTVFAELRGAGRAGGPPQRWNVMNAPDLGTATHDVACRIFRSIVSNGGSHSKDAELFRAIEDEDFCLFNRALEAYDLYRARRLTVPEDAAKFLEQAGKLVTRLVTRNLKFPYVDKLAAIVFLEQGQYNDAERANERYVAWVEKSGRNDQRALEIRQIIKDKSPPPLAAAAGPKSRIRPVRPGTSTGVLGTAGSGMICCLVQMQDGGQALLSADHVFGRTIAAEIVQPGVSDGGKAPDVVADVVASAGAATIARLRNGETANPDIFGFKKITGVEKAITPNQEVFVYGRDGQRRQGTVLAVNATVDIATNNAADGEATLKNVIVTTNISGPGDSGAPVLTGDGELVGMIYAGSQSSTIVVPIYSVLNELKVTLVQ